MAEGVMDGIIVGVGVGVAVSVGVAVLVGIRVTVGRANGKGAAITASVGFAGCSGLDLTIIISPTKITNNVRPTPTSKAGERRRAEMPLDALEAGSRFPNHVYTS